MKTFFGRLAACLLALTALVAMPASAAPQFTMKLSTSTTNDALVEWLNTFKKGVDARSGGRIKIEVYPSNLLGATPRVIEGVAMGTIEVTMNSHGFFEALEPRFAIFSAAGLFDNMDHGTKVLNDPDIRKRLATFGASKGVEVLTVIMHAPMAVATRKPVQQLSDFTSQKIRVPGSTYYLDTMKRLGTAPLSMPLGEVLPALQNGTIDGLMAANTIFSSLKYYDVVKNMTMLPSTHLIAVAIINRDFLKSLGKDLEAIVREEARKADAHIAVWAKEDVEKERKVWEQHGGRIHVMAAGEQQKFLQVTEAAKGSLLSSPQVKADYEAFAQVAQKYRK